MKFRAFESFNELEEFCDSLSNGELSETINNGSEEYGYKIDVNECAFSKYELELMAEILENRI